MVLHVEKGITAYFTVTLCSMFLLECYSRGKFVYKENKEFEQTKSEDEMAIS